MACCLLLLSGCAGVKELSGPEFLDRAKEIGAVHTMKNTELIGVAGDRVYLELWQETIWPGSGLTVFWTRLSGLPDEIAASLKAGRNPWE